MHGGDEISAGERGVQKLDDRNLGRERVDTGWRREDLGEVWYAAAENRETPFLGKGEKGWGFLAWD